MNKINAKKRISIIRYSASAVLCLLFNAALLAGVITFIAGSGVLLWSAITVCLFIFMMLLRDRYVRQEIADGLHDPVWGKHIMRQRQRERDAANEKNWLTRPLFRFACLTGIYKKQ